MPCDRYWLLTWTTYATWLPGDRRGFVSNVADDDGQGVRFNTPGTPYVKDVRPLRGYAAEQISEPMWLTSDQAQVVLTQFRETATFRGWVLFAAAVMRNHVHLVVGVPGDPEPEDLLRDFKSYASRRLNQRFGRRDRWWTQSGSKRKLPNQDALIAAVRYVKNQDHPLVVWSLDDDGDQLPGERPTGERPTGERPTGERPTGERPTGERPTGERPTGERPA